MPQELSNKITFSTDGNNRFVPQDTEHVSWGNSDSKPVDEEELQRLIEGTVRTERSTSTTDRS